MLAFPVPPKRWVRTEAEGTEPGAKRWLQSRYRHRPPAAIHSGRSLRLRVFVFLHPFAARLRRRTEGSAVPSARRPQPSPCVGGRPARIDAIEATTTPEDVHGLEQEEEDDDGEAQPRDGRPRTPRAEAGPQGRAKAGGAGPAGRPERRGHRRRGLTARRHPRRAAGVRAANE